MAVGQKYVPKKKTILVNGKTDGLILTHAHMSPCPPFLRSAQVTHQEHFEAAKKQEKDPEGGPFPAYPSGKTWDEATERGVCGQGVGREELTLVIFLTN